MDDKAGGPSVPPPRFGPPHLPPPSGQYRPPPHYPPPLPNPPTDRSGGDRGDSSWVWLMVAGVALVVIGVGLGAFVLLGGDGDTATTEVTGADRPDTPVASATPDPAVDGKLFEDPNGMFTITIGNDWVDEPGTEGLSFSSWIIGDQSGSSSPTVSVVTDPTGSRTLDDVLNFTDDDLGPDFEIVNKSTVKSASGEDLASIEYVESDTGLHFVGFAQFSNGVLNIVTLRAPEAVFASQRPRVEPFLLTIKGT